MPIHPDISPLHFPTYSLQVIDNDPEFSRVVRYMRPSDWATWGGALAGGPGLLLLFEKLEPARGNKFAMPSASIMRAATMIGFAGGFYMAYVRSSKRFWGWAENSREVGKDRYEMKKFLSEGKNPYGDSMLSPYQQDMSSRNSTNSQLILSVFPWFNVANHQSHGIDLRRYYEVRPGEEKWGFQLKPLEEIPNLSINSHLRPFSNYP